ncbi:hypothetical protein EDB89DRAFT_1907635 [Lactarius sanguifluus]|nr:hypothetical protein EDB89DRAFT_1907635 [Lactarius sanguifluus]
MPMSDFEYLPSATVDQPEPAPTLSSTPPSSSISSTFLPSPARLATEDQSKPESTPTLFASVPTLTSTPTHVHSATDYGTIFASTPPSSSPTSSMLLPSPVTSATDFQPKSEPASESLVSKFGLFPRMLSLPPDQTLAPLSSSTLSSLPLQETSSLGSLPVAPSPDQPSSLLESLSQLSRPCELESSTLVSAADVVTLSHPELPLSSPGEPVPFLPASSETPPNAPISPHSTLPQRRPELKTIGSVSTPLEVYEVLSIKLPVLAPRLCLFHSSPSPRLSSTSIHFGFAFALVTAAVLVSTLINVSATLLTHASKLWSKNQDTGNSQNSTPGYKTGNNLAHRLQHGQYTPRALRFVFDPGGQASSSSFKLLSAHEDIRQRKSKTRNGLHHMHDTSLPTPVPINNPVFDPGGVAFV